MGFISLLLAVGQTPISKICIPTKAGNIMLPCKAQKDDDSESGGDARRRLLWYSPYSGEEYGHHRRFLAGAAATDDYCDKQVRPRPPLQLRRNKLSLSCMHVRCDGDDSISI